MKKNTKKKGSVSGEQFTEHLVHFHCGACRKWWSVGDAPKRTGWYCPWCGLKQKISTKNI